MKQQDKDLLIKDLCARIPYETLIVIDGMYNTHLDLNVISAFMYGSIENVKPYLFHVSSMTEEQREEYNSMVTEELMEIIEDEAEIKPEYKYIDWLNEHHFDYRGLIDKSLAIDATNLNIY